MPDLATVLIVVASTVALTLWKVAKFYLEHKKPFRELPMAAGSNFLFGHSVLWFGAPIEEAFNVVTVDSANEYGQTGFWMGHVPHLSVTHWEDATKVLRSEISHWGGTDSISAILMEQIKFHTQKFLGRFNILFQTGKSWKALRSTIHKAFLPCHHPQYQAIMHKTVETLAGSLKFGIQTSNNDALDMDVLTMVKWVGADVFGEAAFDADLGCCKSLKSGEIVEAYEFLQHEAGRRQLRPFDPWANCYELPSELNRSHARASHMLRTFVGKKLRESKQCGKEHTGILATLNNGSDGCGHGLPDEAVTDLALGLFFAGYETTSTALAYTLYLLANHPNVEQNCVDEIQSVGDDSSNPDKFPYCKAVFMEALRLYPSALEVVRYANRPIELSGDFVAPKGTMILVPIWSIHRNEHNWPQADSFRPDRWVKKAPKEGCWVERKASNEDENDPTTTIPAANPKAFLGFSAGGRSCPGSKFATQEAILILAGLLKEFQFQVKPGYTLNPVRSAITLQTPKGGMPMVVKLRPQASAEK